MHEPCKIRTGFATQISTPGSQVLSRYLQPCHLLDKRLTHSQFSRVQVLHTDRTRVIAGDRPSGTKDAVQAMLDEQANASNGNGNRASNGRASSLANVTITGATKVRTSNGNGNGSSNGVATNGNGSAAAAVIDLDACDAGQLETCAATRIAEEERARSKASTSTSEKVLSPHPPEPLTPDAALRAHQACSRADSIYVTLFAMICHTWLQPSSAARCGATRHRARLAHFIAGQHMRHTKLPSTFCWGVVSCPHHAAAGMQAPGDDGVGGSSSDLGTPYKAAGFSAWRRTIQIYSFAIVFAFKYWRLNKKSTYKNMEGGMSPENVSAKKTELAKWLKAGLIKLGPTFIKIGQQFSTRVDVLSPEFIKELEELQDNVRSYNHCLPAPCLFAPCERSTICRTTSATFHALPAALYAVQAWRIDAEQCTPLLAASPDITNFAVVLANLSLCCIQCLPVCLLASS